MPADFLTPRRRLFTPFRLLLGFLAISLVGLVLFVVSLSKLTEPHPARDGRGFYRAGRYYSAIQQFNRALQLDPNDASTLYWRGLSFLATGDAGRAIDDLEAVRRLAPDTERIEERLGRAYLEDGDHARAREIFERLAGDEPDNPRVLHLLAQTHYNLYLDHLTEIGALVERYVGGDLAAELLRDLELLVFSRQVDEDLRALLEQNERVFDSSGERELTRLIERAHLAIERSIPQFRAALAVPEFDPKAALSLARIYRRQGRLGWTRDECEDAIRRCMDPIQSLPFRFLLAAVYFEMGVFTRCADVYRETLSLAEDLDRRGGLSDEAQAEVSDAWQEAIDRLLPVLLELEDYQTVRELAAKRGDPQKEPILYFYLGTSALKTGEIEAARQYLRRAKIAFENKPALRIRYREAFLDTYLDLANLAIAESQFGQAENHLASLLQRDPTSARGHLALAELRRRQGNERGALQSLEVAMYQNPGEEELFQRWWDLWTASFVAKGLPADAPRPDVWRYYSVNSGSAYMQMRAGQAVLDSFRNEEDAQLALKIIERISIFHSDFLPMKKLQAAAFLARGDFELAQELFEVVLETSPEDPVAILGMRDCAIGLEDADGIQSWNHEALKVGADDEGPTALLERLIQSGRTNRALAYSEQLLTLANHRSLDVEMLRLRALLEEGAIETVQDRLSLFIERGIQHPSLLTLTIRTHLRTGKIVRASEMIRKNLEHLDAEFFHVALSDILPGEATPPASNVVKMALVRFPNDERIADQASRYFRQIRSYAEAVDILRRAASGGALPTRQLLDLTLMSIPIGKRIATGSPEWLALEKQLAAKPNTRTLLAILLELSGESERALASLPKPNDPAHRRTIRTGWPNTIFAVHLRQGSSGLAADALAEYGPQFRDGYRRILEYCVADGLYKTEVTEAMLELALFGQIPEWDMEALESLEFLLSVFPANKALRRLHPRLRAQTGATPAEVLALTKQLAEESPSASNYRALTDLQLELRQYGDAVRSLLKIRELGHPAPDDLLSMAKALAGAGEPLSAARIFDVLFRFDERIATANAEPDRSSAGSLDQAMPKIRLVPDWKNIAPETLLTIGELFADGLPESPVQDPVERLLPPRYPGRRVLAGALQPPSWELLPTTILGILRRQPLNQRQALRVFDLLQTRSSAGERAISLIERLLKSDPSSVPMAVFSVDARLSLPNPITGEALDALLMGTERAIDRGRLEPELRAYYLGHLAELHLDHGSAEQAQRLLRRALVLTPDRPALYRLMGEAAAALGDDQDAELEYRTATRLFPWDAEAWAQLAWFYGEQGLELSKAAQLIARRLVEQPDEPALLTGMAWIRYQQGRAFDAAQLAESALFRAPGSSRAAFVLGLASYALGRLQEAVEPLRLAATEPSQLRGDDLEYAKILLFRARRRLGQSPEEARAIRLPELSAGPK